MFLSNLRKWSRTIPTISTVFTGGQINAVPKFLAGLTPKLEVLAPQAKTLYFARTECFSLFRPFKKQRLGLSHKGKGKSNSMKKRSRRKVGSYKLPSHNGLLHRIRIVGPRHARRFKFMSAFKRHGNRRKTHNNLRRKMKSKYLKPCDVKRVKKLIPLWKRQKFKAAH